LTPGGTCTCPRPAAPRWAATCLRGGALPTRRRGRPDRAAAGCRTSRKQRPPATPRAPAGSAQRVGSEARTARAAQGGGGARGGAGGARAGHARDGRARLPAPPGAAGRPGRGRPRPLSGRHPARRAGALRRSAHGGPGTRAQPVLLSHICWRLHQRAPGRALAGCGTCRACAQRALAAGRPGGGAACACAAAGPRRWTRPRCCARWTWARRPRTPPRRSSARSGASGRSCAVSRRAPAPRAPLCVAAAARPGAGAPRGLAVRQDGAIAEAVVWESGPARRHLVADALLGYALPRHLPGAAVAGTAGLLDGALAQRGASADQLASARRCAPRRPRCSRRCGAGDRKRKRLPGDMRARARCAAGRQGRGGGAGEADAAAARPERHGAARAGGGARGRRAAPHGGLPAAAAPAGGRRARRRRRRRRAAVPGAAGAAGPAGGLRCALPGPRRAARTPAQAGAPGHRAARPTRTCRAAARVGAGPERPRPRQASGRTTRRRSPR